MNRPQESIGAQAHTPAQEHAERVVQRLMRRYSLDTRRPVPPSAQDTAFKDWLGVASGMLTADLSKAAVQDVDLQTIGLDAARQRLCVALKTADGATALVLADPFDRDHRLWLEARLRQVGHPRTRWYVTPVQALLSFLERLEQQQQARRNGCDGVRTLRPTQPLTGRETGAVANVLGHPPPPVLEALDELLRQAMAARASHIHLHRKAAAPTLLSTPTPVEPSASPVEVYWRVDGWRRPATLHATAGMTLAASQSQDQGQRLSLLHAVMNHLHQAAHAPGGLAVVYRGQTHLIRLAVTPQPPESLHDSHHDNVVLHLPRSLQAESFRSLEALGHAAPLMPWLHHLLQVTHGLWLVVAPPQGGKTSTLHALAREARALGRRVSLLTQPSLAQLHQAQSQDLDAWFIDEVSDATSAAWLLDQALAGRPIVMSVAAAEPWSALLRLVQLGLSRAGLAASLKGLLHQQLLRLNCPHCSERIDPMGTPDPLYSFPPDAAHWQFMQGLGCQDCEGSGGLGRQVVGTWLPFTPALAQHLSADATPQAFWHTAQQAGFVDLRTTALTWVRQGRVAWEEANRVVAVAR